MSPRKALCGRKALRGLVRKYNTVFFIWQIKSYNDFLTFLGLVVGEFEKTFLCHGNSCPPISCLGEFFYKNTFLHRAYKECNRDCVSIFRGEKRNIFCSSDILEFADSAVVRGDHKFFAEMPCGERAG